MQKLWVCPVNQKWCDQNKCFAAQKKKHRKASNISDDWNNHLRMVVLSFLRETRPWKVDLPPSLIVDLFQNAGRWAVCAWIKLVGLVLTRSHITSNHCRDLQPSRLTGRESATARSSSSTIRVGLGKSLHFSKAGHVQWQVGESWLAGLSLSTLPTHCTNCASSILTPSNLLKSAGRKKQCRIQLMIQNPRRKGSRRVSYPTNSEFS